MPKHKAMRRINGRFRERRTSAETRDDLIKEYGELVDVIAKKLIGSMGIPKNTLNDLKSAGFLGLIDAAEHTNTKNKEKFRTYACIRIKGAIIDSIREDSELSREVYQFARAFEATNNLRELELEEVSGQGQRQEELVKFLNYAAKGALIFKLSMMEAKKEVMDLITSEPLQDEKCIAVQEGLKIRWLIESLPKDESYVLRELYFADKTLSELCKDQKDGSKSISWLSRVHYRAIDNLKMRYASCRVI